MKTFILFTILFCFCTVPCVAQDRYRLPKVETNEAGEKCLDKDQWDQVLLVASEYKGLYLWRLEISPTLQGYQDVLATYDVAFGKMELQLKIYEKNHEYLTTRLDQSEKQLNKRLKISKFEKGIMWGIIAIETVVIGIFGIRGVSQ